MGAETMGSSTSGSTSKHGQQLNRLRSNGWRRWLPAVAAPVVIAGAALVATNPANAGDPLPAKTPAEVMALAASHPTSAFSGTIEQSSVLGLPELPAGSPTSGAASPGGAASVVELLSGDHTARVYMDGKAKLRIQVVDRLAERDLVRNGNDVWFYSSKDNSTTHLTLPDRASDLPLPASPSPESPVPAMPDPQDIAQHFLDRVDPSTSVSVKDDVQVAGRAAYNLVLEPRTDGTLVGSVAIAVDGVTGMPLSVQVTARGASSPAFRAAFTSLSLVPPDQSRFTFSPPPGSTVKELPAPDPGQAPHMFPKHPAGTKDPSAVPHPGDHRTAGTGWETVVAVPARETGGNLAGTLLKDPLLSQAAVAVPNGRLLSTALVNVLITDDGRIFAGMVPPDTLQAAASAAP